MQPLQPPPPQPPRATTPPSEAARDPISDAHDWYESAWALGGEDDRQVNRQVNRQVDRQAAAQTAVAGDPRPLSPWGLTEASAPAGPFKGERGGSPVPPEDAPPSWAAVAPSKQATAAAPAAASAPRAPAQHPAQHPAGDADSEEVRSLRLQLRLLRGASARAELLERSQREASSLMRQLERQVQAKTREAASLSVALQAAYHAGAKRRAPSSPRQPQSARAAPAMHHQAAAVTANARAHGFELIQVLADPQLEPWPQSNALGPSDALAVLEKSPRVPAALRGVPLRPPGPSAGSQTVIRMRGCVYMLKELKRSVPDPAGLAQRVDEFARFALSTLPTAKPEPQAAAQHHPPQPSQPRQPPGPPPPHRRAPVQRPHSATSARGISDPMSPREGQAVVSGKRGSGPGRPSRPQSAQAALRRSAAAAGAAGLQQANAAMLRGLS
jgi:hypothetical protein